MSEAIERVEQKNIIGALEKEIGDSPSKIYLISPGVSRDSTGKIKTATMSSPELFRGDKTGYIGGSLRLYATAYLHNYFPIVDIITSSTIEGVSHADIQEKELEGIWKKWGMPVDLENLRKEEKSYNTITEMAELIRLIESNNWTGTVAAVTNEYHVPRTKKILELLPNLVEDSDFKRVWERFGTMNDVGVKVVSAEAVLGIVSPKFKNMLESVFEREPFKSAWRKRLQLEAQGIKDLEEGNYKPLPLKL